jgi:hypothetical protein
MMVTTSLEEILARAVSVVTLIMVMCLIVYYAIFRPIVNWDAIGYTAAALKSGHDISDLHKQGALYPRFSIF